MRLKLAAIVGLFTMVALVGCAVDSADEPTLTPQTSTAAEATGTQMPVASLTATTAPPTPTATSAPTPATPTVPAAPPLEVVEGAFEIGHANSVYIDMLSRVPNTPNVRGEVRMHDRATVASIIGLGPPQADMSSDQLLQHYEDAISKMEESGFSMSAPLPVLPAWPWEMRRYTGSWNPYPYTHIAPYMAEQSLAAGSPPNRLEIAVGSLFSAKATDEALQSCDCEQPDVHEYGGETYYSWGESGAAELRRRLEPPLYDYLGRGPRLLVNDGYAYYTIENSAMEGMIDATRDAAPSLADSADHEEAVQWLTGMGTPLSVSITDQGFGIDEIVEDEIRGRSSVTTSSGVITTEYTEASVRQALTKTDPLLPFSTAAWGIGYDGEALFTGVVIVHADEKTAEENLARLTARLQDGATHGRIENGQYAETAWRELISAVEAEREDRFVLLRIFSRDHSLFTHDLFARPHLLSHN